jgi:hypothetical protein
MIGTITVAGIARHWTRPRTVTHHDDVVTAAAPQAAIACDFAHVDTALLRRFYVLNRPGFGGDSSS